MNFLLPLLCAITLVTLVGAISPHVVLVIIDDYVSRRFSLKNR